MGIFLIESTHVYISRFPRRLENLENESGHGKVMEQKKNAKSHGIL